MAISRLSQTTLQNGFQKYNNIWDGTSAVGSMDAIGVVSLTATTSSVVFSNIPQTYSHLQLRITGKSARANSYGSTIFTQVNSDTTPANYKSHYLVGDGTSVSGGAVAQNTGYYLYAGLAMGSNATNVTTTNITDIYDYSVVGKYKTSKALLGECTTTPSGYCGMYTSVWMGTAAITSLTLVVFEWTWASGSLISLYGIK